MIIVLRSQISQNLRVRRRDESAPPTSDASETTEYLLKIVITTGRCLKVKLKRDVGGHFKTVFGIVCLVSDSGVDLLLADVIGLDMQDKQEGGHGKGWTQ